MSTDTIDSNENDKSSPTGLLVLAGYALAGFLTFGHIFNMNYIEPQHDCGAEPDIIEQYSAWDKWYWCTHPRYVSMTEGAAPVAVAAGIAWPIYWGGHFAIKVTK